MAQPELPPYFIKRLASGNPVVRDPPKFDLDVYIANYTGPTRLDRLLLIGQTSTFLSQEALKTGIAEAKGGKNVGPYRTFVETLQQVAPQDPDSKLDALWIERMTKQVKAETDRLEFELKGYKNNLIKESIRMGNEDLGQHYLAIGEYSLAGKAFGRMRDQCTSSKHVADMCLKLSTVAIQQGDWMAVQSNALKMRNLQYGLVDGQELAPKIKVLGGISMLAQGCYREAGVGLHAVETELGNSFNEIIAPNDVAVYTALCALVGFTRAELHERILESPKVRVFLELEPHLRRAISLFCNSKYSQCLEILEAYKPDYLLDVRLHEHIPRIYKAIRSRCIEQYFVPFSCVTLANMASVFATDEASMEEELVDMIQQSQLNARIDTQNRLLIATQSNLRQTVHTDTLAAAKRYERTARLRLMRMNIMAAGLDVKPPKLPQSQHAEDAIDELGSMDESGSITTGVAQTG